MTWGHLTDEVKSMVVLVTPLVWTVHLHYQILFDLIVLFYMDSLN